MLKQIVQANTEEERMENDIWMKFSIMATMNPGYHKTKDRFREVNLDFAKDILKMLYNNGYINYPNVEDSANSLTIFIHSFVFESVIYSKLYNNQVIEKEIKEYLRKICN